MGLLKVSLSKNRVFGLDLLRALAILFVVYSHTIQLLIKIWPKKIFTAPVFDGVSIFFVLSGFLIGGILIRILESKEATWPTLVNFWIRRWFRTLPNYFLVFLLLFVLQGLLRGKTTFMEAWQYLFFIQNFDAIHPFFFPEAWSLSVEEWFYILIPVCVFVLRAFKVKTKNSLLITISIVLLFSVAVRYFRFVDIEKVTFNHWDNIFRKQVITRLDSIIFGVIGAWLSHYYSKFWNNRKRFWLVVGIFLMIVHKALIYFRIDLGLNYNLYYTVFSFSLISIATLALLPFLSTYHLKEGRAFRFFTTISLISYSMYLINLSLVQHVFMRALYKIWPLESSTYTPAAYFVVAWSATIVGSIIIYKYFEMPTTRLREKFNFSKIRSWFTKSN